MRRFRIGLYASISLIAVACATPVQDYEICDTDGCGDPVNIIVE